ncbi:MAG: helix-turn-helix transcriptional regulator [Desulfobacteraceae bacterium]
MTITLTEPQVIIQKDKPAFAVIPWDEYQILIKSYHVEANEKDVWFPNDVVKANVRGDSLIKAWREHFGMTQEELSVKAGIKQPTLARMEKQGANPRKSSLIKLAEAMGLIVEQLMD